MRKKNKSKLWRFEKLYHEAYSLTLFVLDFWTISIIVLYLAASLFQLYIIQQFNSFPKPTKMDTRNLSSNLQVHHPCIVSHQQSSPLINCGCPNPIACNEDIYEAYGEANITRCTTQLKQMVDGNVIPKQVRSRFRPRVVRFQILRQYIHWK